MRARLVGILSPGIVPLDQNLLPLGRGQKWQSGEVLAGVGGHTLQQRPQMAEHPPNHVVVETAAVVDDLEHQLFSRPTHHGERVVGLLDGTNVLDRQAPILS